ncbi:DUF2637 domain-containing protein [Kocuria sp. SL71]|uniref:DUF2637 domain-containing protein n=1 Tax=Kocuria sp. SL71 TaxID=2995151 RepID=UPI0022728091|nr:DUF2637 domain-containing protein [Kocuria sp. SL71]MCY1685116.1 DUF2637 domain-containing protein [Kocuria sp. SL71]
MTAERTENDARPAASGRASHQQEVQDLGGSTLMGDTVAPTPKPEVAGTSRIDPDTRGIQWTVVVLVGLLGLTSFAVSFRALHDVAAWAGIGPGLQWAVPVFIDGAILTYALAVLVHRSRGESVWPSWTSLAVFTAMSVAANAAHAVAAPQELWWQIWVGATLAALAPLGVFAATEQMARLVVLRPQDRQVSVSPVVALPASAAPLESPVDSPAPGPEEPQEPAEEPTPERETPAENPAPEAPVEGPEEPAEQSDSEAKSEVVSEPEGPSEDEFVAWVQRRRREGEAITGPTAGAFLGVSERTGRNRIKELRAARPELFEEDAA